MPSRDRSERESRPPPSERDIEAMWNELQGLRGQVLRLEQVSAIENVLENGFDRMAVYLQPLADLTARRIPLKEPEASHLGQIRAALLRPDWRDIREQQPTGEDRQKRMTAS
jgi:hypothetical protein